MFFIYFYILEAMILSNREILSQCVASIAIVFYTRILGEDQFHPALKRE